MKINVLGKEYNIEFRNKKTDAALLNCDGYCDETIGLIVVDEMTPDLSTDNKRDLKKQQALVLRHEIIHAFLYESGLAEFSRNELFVDWFATQFCKIEKVFNQIDCKGVD